MRTWFPVFCLVLLGSPAIPAAAQTSKNLVVQITPQVVERDQCRACRRLKRVRKADPRMARLLHEHPALDRWRRWRMSETSRVYVLVATGWLRRLLVVADKETLELRHMATASRFSARWADVEPSQFAYVLRE